MKENILTVSDLTRKISNALQKGIGTVSLKGELSNFKQHSSGHRYFSLKDDGAQISGVMWRSRRLSFVPRDGMEVIVNGAISVYPPRGSYQIDCSSMRPLGQGDLFAAFEALKAKLHEAGYFDSERKRTLPALPETIGVATSPTGAAVRDILSTLERRLPTAEILFRPTLVQGDGAAEDIVKAINELASHSPDVIIAGRGGGSMEDLWCFNEEIVANAIYNCPVPIVSAVGHETDFTISDFVADIRAATPTAAAELVSPNDLPTLLESIKRGASDMESALNTLLSELRNRIDSVAKSYAFRNFNNTISNYSMQLDDIETDLTKSISRRIQDQKKKLFAMEQLLQASEPLLPLSRGFALLQENGRIIGSDEPLSNKLQIDLRRQYEIAKVTINEIKKI